MPIQFEGITLYTVKDIEDLLGVGNSTVRRYISQGKLKGRKLARRWYVPSENLLEYFTITDRRPPEDLLERMQVIEEHLREKQARREQRQRERVSARIKPQVNPPAPPPPAPVIAPAKPPPPVPPQESFEIEELLRQARRLKEEAARIEQRYTTTDK